MNTTFLRRFAASLPLLVSAAFPAVAAGPMYVPPIIHPLPYRYIPPPIIKLPPPPVYIPPQRPFVACTQRPVYRFDSTTHTVVVDHDSCDD